MIHLNKTLTPADLSDRLDRFFSLAGNKIKKLDQSYDTAKGSPVFTVAGRYTSKGWTEWTQGFQYGLAVLHFDATGDTETLEMGRRQTLTKMAPHVSHIGVHDHGFNNLSTYGNLRRLQLEGRLPANDWEQHFYELAIKVSGAVQASRWSERQGGGYIYSFNGPHSLFVDTLRSCRILMLAHKLGHTLMGEGDKPISLLGRALEHIRSTAEYSIWYGKGRDAYDIRGRTAHECIFNCNDGAFRCPNSQQGYTGFSTWTRGLAWALLGFAEELEFIDSIDTVEFEAFGGKDRWWKLMLEGAKATADFYLEYTPTDGIPYWDTGAPGLVHLGDYLKRPAEPVNDHEPVDSSAAAITAQGLIRLGQYLGESSEGKDYYQAGLTVAARLFEEPYLSIDPEHEGLILHSIYHRPNGWDHIPDGSKIPHGESSMWGDYHAMELAVLIQRLAKGGPRLSFFGEGQ